MTYIPDGPLLLPLPPFQNVAAGSRATMSVPLGPTYQSITLLCLDNGGAGTTKAQMATAITSIRGTVNGREKFNISGAEAVMLAEFYNTGVVSPGDNGTLPLAFARPWMELENITKSGHGNQDGPAYGTSGLNTLQLEIVLAAAQTDCVSLSGFAQQTAPEELGVHLSIRRYVRNFGAASTDRIIDLPIKGTPTRPLTLYAMHISDANIDNVELLIDRSRVWFADRDIIHHQYLYPRARRTVQTGWTHLDFVGLRNRNADALTFNRPVDVELALDFTSAPGDFDILLELVEVMPAQRAA